VLASGLFLFALGLGSRSGPAYHIGRNWGTPMSQKDDPELVTSGPYGLVRHPIYSGVLLAVSAPGGAPAGYGSSPWS